jgi:putative DNA methylase
MDKRYLIEQVLPIQVLSQEARREKAIRHGHISTLHVWWARRPLVVSRAAVLGALLTESAEVDEEFIAHLCRWEVHDGDPGGRYLLEQARRLIRQRFGGQPPKVLDSFAGGGSIPLEALRLGAEAYALEYNPVAYLILKATIEYPQRYGQKLASEVKRWGEWVLECARRELAAFYPTVGGETPIAYIWSRTIRCPNPACGAEIPLFRQFWLARKANKKANKKVALEPIPNPAAKRVDFAIVHGDAADFDPSRGTVSRGNAVCLVCQASARDSYVKAEAQAGRMGHRLVAVVTTRGKGQGRNYRLATEEDLAAFRNAEEALQNLLQTPSPWAFGLSWVPEEPMDQPKETHRVSGRANSYFTRVRQWQHLFNPRQLLALVTFGKWVREAHRGNPAARPETPTSPEPWQRIWRSAIGISWQIAQFHRCQLLGQSWREEVAIPDILPRITMQDGNGILRRSQPSQRCAIGSWISAMNWNARDYGYTAREIRASLQVGSVHLGSAAALPFPDRHFDAVVVDPPYADNVPYADLSDFFYVWLRRTVGDLYPEAFQWTLTPKDEEAVVNPARFGGGKTGRADRPGPLPAADAGSPLRRSIACSSPTGWPW